MTHLSTIKPLQCFSGPYGEEVLVIKVADSKGVLTVTYQAGGNLHHLDVASFSATMSHQGVSSQANSLLGVLRRWLSIPIRKRRDSHASFAAELQSHGFLPKLLDYAEEIVGSGIVRSRLESKGNYRALELQMKPYHYQIVEHKSERAAADLLKRDATKRARKKHLESKPCNGGPLVNDKAEENGCVVTAKPNDDKSSARIATQKLEAKQRQKKLTVIEDDPGITKFDPMLEVPPEVSARIDALNGLAKWETEAWSLCAAFDNACRHTPTEKHVEAEAVGKFIAQQLVAGNTAVLSVVEVGLKNISSGKKFRPMAGKQLSAPERIAIAVAFFELKKEGLMKPSRSETGDRVKLNTGSKPQRDRISKVFEELGLRGLAGDARDMRCEAGWRKRKPKIKHVANQDG